MVDLNSPMDVQCAGFCSVLFVSSIWSGRIILFKVKKLLLNCGMEDEALPKTLMIK